jgi:hypothetical protein
MQPKKRASMRLRWPWANRPAGPAGRVRTQINYVVKEERRPVSNLADPLLSHIPQAGQTVDVEDVRRAPRAPLLQCEGFALFRHSSSVTDFRDVEQIRQVHLAEAEQIVRSATGARYAYALEKPVLRSMDHERIARPGLIASYPALVAHSDYTDRSVGPLMEDVLRRAGLAEAPTGRVAVFNVWRSLRAPPQERPLAICDVRTVAEADLIRADCIGNDAAPEDEAEFYFVQSNPSHRWCYFSAMTPDEVLIFRQYDSHLPVPSGCPHAAFHDPRCPAETEPRLSIETRVCAFLDPEPAR